MAQLAAFLNAGIMGVRVVRAFGAESEDEHRFRAVNEHVYAGYRRTVTWTACSTGSSPRARSPSPDSSGLAGST